MQNEETAPTIRNEYDSMSGFRTATGVLSSLLFMGVPIGLTELLRAGGDKGIAGICGIATVAAIVLAYLSIRGTMKDA